MVRPLVGLQLPARPGLALTVPSCPAGGVLYERLGYRAPFIFSIILVAVDLVLRIFIIEKHHALKWIRAGHEIPNFEAPGYIAAGTSSATLAEPETSVPLGGAAAPRDKHAQEHADEVERSEGKHERLPPHVLGLLHMLKDPRALTSFAVTLLNGTIAGGLQDTALTLWVEQQYGLNSLGAGLVFLGIVVPTFFVRAPAAYFASALSALVETDCAGVAQGSPLAGWVRFHRPSPSLRPSRRRADLFNTFSQITDRHGTKWIMLLGIVISIPAYPLLIIRGPLPLFIFFLAIIGESLSARAAPTSALTVLCLITWTLTPLCPPPPRRSRYLVLHHAHHGRPLHRRCRHAVYLHRPRLWRVQPGVLGRRPHWCVAVSPFLFLNLRGPLLSSQYPPLD